MLSKVYGEYLCKFSNLPITIIRPHNFYGPRMGLSHVIPELIQKIYLNDNNKIKIFSYNHSRTFYFIDDAIQEIFKLIHTKKSLGEIYNIGSNKEITILNLAKLIRELLHSKVELIKSEEAHNSPKRRQSSKRVSFNANSCNSSASLLTSVSNSLHGVCSLGNNNRRM